MIALQTINNKEFKILAGKTIPEDILKKLDVKRLTELKIISEEKKPKEDNEIKTSNFKYEKKESK